MILRNGIEIPDIGFGTWNIPYGEVCERAVFEAIRAGYRHIDTAGAYGNERSVGLGVKAAIHEGLIILTSISYTGLPIKYAIRIPPR